MLKFVIGVDKRTGRLGADLERLLCQTYDIAEFEIVGINGTLPRNSIRSLASQADCILEVLCDFPARYYLAISTGRVVAHTPTAAIPLPMTIMTAIDANGLVLFDCVEPIGHYLPVEQRRYTPLMRTPDLLDIVHNLMVEIAGTQPEPLPAG